MFFLFDKTSHVADVEVVENVSQCERYRKRSDEDRARGLRGIPSHVFRFLRAQVLSGLAFAAYLLACLFFSVEPGLVTDVDARQSSVNATGA